MPWTAGRPGMGLAPPRQRGGPAEIRVPSGRDPDLTPWPPSLQVGGTQAECGGVRRTDSKGVRLVQRVTVGRPGIVVSRLGLRTGATVWGGSSNQTRLGFDRLVRSLCYAHDRGITFWD